MSGSGAGHAVERPRNGSSVLGDRDREAPAGREVAPRAPQERDPAVAAAEQLDRLHRHDAQREPPAPRSNVAGVRAHGVERELTGALGELVQQLVVEVERGDAVAARGEVERDPPGAGADVEHRVAVLAGERAPQRQVLGVAAALEVVPDDVQRRARSCRCQNCATCPRAASSSRSSSSAV